MKKDQVPKFFYRSLAGCDNLLTADKGPGLKDKLRFWKGSKRGGKVQVQEVEDGVQVTEEISGIVDKGKDNKKSGKEKHNEEELQTLRSEVEIPEIVDKGKDNTKSEKEKHNEEDELQTNTDKGPGLKDKLRFWKGSKRGGKVQVQEVEDGVQVTEEISGIVDKGKDNKKSGKEKHNEEELQTLRSEVEIPEIVDKGKDNTKSEKEKHNEEEIQTLRSRVDELQTNAGGVSGVDGKTTADDLPPSSPPDEPQTKAGKAASPL
ncbi:uncharacterized protein LOC128826357 [Malaclemys terrapin pileata]|uniref:uncharacterized protein LOC128826357 n=1 Tax=Malaclemys terrapin pileata TaxID=2991368 RepID=UPI0023A79103|nr:uncharacterized protein LOC128826357 [Malaclemys terrapin pileata]